METLTTTDVQNVPTNGEALEQAVQRCLEELFARFQKADIPFCVLRNRDRIPAGLLQGSDVDVLLTPSITPQQLIDLLSDMHPVQIAQHRSTIEVYFPVHTIFLHVDLLISDREWRGARYLENRSILAEREDDQGIPVASSTHQAFCAWFSSLLRCKRFKPRYIPLIVAATRDMPERMRFLLLDAFGKRLGTALMELATRGKLTETDSLAGKCRRVVWLRALARRPAATLAGLLHHYWCEVKRYIRPPGMVVAILGPDGAGKSSVCAALQAAPRAKLPFRSVETHHMYERVLPLLSELRHGRVRHKRESGPVNDPHGKRASGAMVSACRLAYFLLDMWLNRVLRSQRKQAHNTLLLHDRHLMEMVVDPRRFRYGGPAWLAAWAIRFMPQPDLVILLDAPEDILQSRKQEVPISETRRQREMYRWYVSRQPNGRIVDATQTTAQVVDDVQREIGQWLAARTAKRLRSG